LHQIFQFYICCIHPCFDNSSFFHLLIDRITSTYSIDGVHYGCFQFGIIKIYIILHLFVYSSWAYN
jgi:hypothetical protein